VNGNAARFTKKLPHHNTNFNKIASINFLLIYCVIENKSMPIKPKINTNHILADKISNTGDNHNSHSGIKVSTFTEYVNFS